MLAKLTIYLQAGSSRLLRSEFFRNLGRYSVSTGAAQVLMMLYTILVARTLGPEQFGRYSGSYAISGLSIFLVSWGMDTLLLREPGSLAAPRVWSGKVLQIKIGLGLVWGTLLVVCAPLIRPDIFTPALMFVCVLDVWCDGALNTHIAALNIQKRIKSLSQLIFFSRLARLLIAVALVLIGTNSLLVFVSARLVTTAGSLLVAMVVLKPDFTARNAPTTRDVLRMTISFGLSDFLAMVYMQADVALITLLAGSTAAGLYSPADQLVNALFVIPTAFFYMVVPVLSNQFTKDSRHLRRTQWRFTFGFLGVGLALALAVLLGGHWAIQLLLGPQYLVTSFLLVILSPLLLF